MVRNFIYVLLTLYIGISGKVLGQQQALDLAAVLEMAMDNNPVLKQFENQRSITDHQVKSALSGWLPQLGMIGDYNRYFSQPVAIFPDFNNPESGEFQEVRTGVPFNSSLSFSADQQLINNELIRDRQQSSDQRKQADQLLEELKIDLTVVVTQTFYEVLLAQEQVSLTREDLRRQQKQLEDAELLFEAGLTDQIDLKRAKMTLQNTQASLYQYQQDIEIRKAQLNALLGRPASSDLKLQASYENLLMEIHADTLQGFQPEQRIEYQLLQTQLALQDVALKYEKRRFLPTLSAFYNYNILFLSPVGSTLYEQAYPYSLMGIRLTYPLFQGGKRHHDSRIAALRLRNLELEKTDLTNSISTELQEALSTYKKQLYQLKTQEANKQLAEEIYEILSLQYEEGIKNFLEVIVAETDLRTARINYYRSLFGVLTSKASLQRARGEIQLEP
ncbi:MAG: TolC family protein [Lunatimonas sp.]|uniref:TolC family protein n=1 Tax=Lunatimonas sp. TaxID=2060141 RepID=UPI00263AE643|nr:TolC family protein [Lunatimonas sp.]MCC5937963.1 TolC family protein [Lunatimonas sp.]